MTWENISGYHLIVVEGPLDCIATTSGFGINPQVGFRWSDKYQGGNLDRAATVRLRL